MRRAFTLIELLVVLALIATVAALSVAATMKFIGVQQASTTRTALTKLQTQLEAHWAEAIRRAKEEPIPDSVRQHPDFAAMVGNDAHANARARVIYVKLKLRQAFPMTFDEALNPHPLPALSPYVTALRNLGIARSTPETLPYESAICLRLALERAPGDGGVKVEDLGVPTIPVTVPGGQATCFVDAWDSPVVFCRWPTGCPELNPNGPSAGRNDPGDPEGLLNVPAWTTSPGAMLFKRLCHDVPGRQGNAPASSYKLVPLVVSAGGDRRLEMALRTLLPEGAGSRDNLYGGGS